MGVLDKWRARTIRFEGEKAHNVIDDLQPEYVDMEVKVAFNQGH